MKRRLWNFANLSAKTTCLGTIMRHSNRPMIRAGVELVAQLVEQCPFKALVVGSSPAQPTIQVQSQKVCRKGTQRQELTEKG